MSALAHILHEKDYDVSGSDSSKNTLTEALTKLGVSIYSEHQSENIKSSETIVVYSTAIDVSNPEIITAKKLGCTLWHRSQLLADLMKSYEGIAITGTHGKTTTSALLSHTFEKSNQSPTFVIGGLLNASKSNAQVGKGRFFVAEADESDKTFLNYAPQHAIITNVEADHLDHYLDFNEIKSSFEQFFSQVKQTLLWCYDCQTLKQMAPFGISYGFELGADAQITSFEQKDFFSYFDLTFENKLYSRIELPMIGRHNVLNAAAVFTLALKLNIDEHDIRTAFRSFQGVSRRSQKITEKNQIQIYDDYAHHPTEIKSTLKSFRERFLKRRIIALFQPHRFTRLMAFKEDFLKAFKDADEVWVTDVYSAGEKPNQEFNISQLASDIQEQSNTSAHYVPSDQRMAFFEKNIQPFDVLITLGAGDITTFAQQAALKLEEFQPQLKAALVCGGSSYEHYISLISSNFIEQNYAKNRLNLSRYLILPTGEWSLYDSTLNQYQPLDFIEVISNLKQSHVIFPVLHGGLGEGGGLQGFFEVLDVPFCGPQHAQSSLAMNKIWMQQLVKQLGIKTTNSQFLLKRDWTDQHQKLLAEIESQLSYPCVVKPACLGSTIGVSFVNSSMELQQAIDRVFEMDEFAIIEPKIIGIDLEIACLDTEDGVVVPHPGQVKSNVRQYDYVAKYSQNPIEKVVQAEIDPKIAQEAQTLARRIYQALGCSSYARIDFFLTNENELIFAEVNTLPGMTPRSLFQRMLINHGLTAEQIIDQMIINALFDHRKVQRQNKHIAHYLNVIKDVTHGPKNSS